jgi:hypothetical protein
MRQTDKPRNISFSIRCCYHYDTRQKDIKTDRQRNFYRRRFDFLDPLLLLFPELLLELLALFLGVRDESASAAAAASWSVSSCASMSAAVYVYIYMCMYVYKLFPGVRDESASAAVYVWMYICMYINCF